MAQAIASRGICLYGQRSVQAQELHVTAHSFGEPVRHERPPRQCRFWRLSNTIEIDQHLSNIQHRLKKAVSLPLDFFQKTSFDPSSLRNLDSSTPQAGRVCRAGRPREPESRARGRGQEPEEEAGGVESQALGGCQVESGVLNTPDGSGARRWRTPKTQAGGWKNKSEHTGTMAPGRQV